MPEEELRALQLLVIRDRLMNNTDLLADCLVDLIGADLGKEW